MTLTTRCLLAMKLTIILLTAAFLQVSAKGTAQSITYSGKNVPLERVFAAIKKQTNNVFFYRNDDLSRARPVTVDLRNVTLEQALEQIFKDQPLSYSIEGNTIIISAKPSETSVFQPEVISLPPPIDVKGRILNENGEPVLATVIVKGTNKGTTTNSDGYFELKNVENNATLVITATNIETREIKINGRTDLDVVSVKMKITSLNEVVINKGYYTEKQKLSVSNVSGITASEIEQQPVQNPLLSLQGRVPGLFIMQPSGIPGSSVRIRIQGRNSIANGNDPLYVVDGVPIISSLPMTGVDGILGPTGPNHSGFGNPLNYINISDVESIDVLKDADATAIYGSRAANGAILITTKKGKPGPMRLDLNMQTGWGKVANHMDVLNTRQYLDMRYEAYANDGINWRSSTVTANDLKVWDTTRYTNWQKELIGNTAHYANVNASLSGGSGAVQYLVGGTFSRETTVFPFSSDFSDRKASVHFSLNTRGASDKLRMQLTGNYMFDHNRLPRVDLTQKALFLEPVAPSLYNPDGSVNWAPNPAGTSTFSANPMIDGLSKYWNKTYNLVSNLVLGYKILPQLEISTSVGYNNMQTDDFRGNPLTISSPESRLVAQRSASYGDRNIKSWIAEPQLSYNTNIGPGKFEVQIGATILDLKSSAGYLFGSGHPSDEMLENIQASASVGAFYIHKSDYRYNAGFGRINYNWKDKYVINLSARRDGSSRFGDANRFHNFGSAGAGWLFSNEKFVSDNVPFLSFGKIRGSYGSTGNDQIGDYAFLSLYNIPPIQVPYQGVVSIAPSGLSNRHLQWEETRKLQIGMDLGFLKDRIVFSTTYVRNRSSNQLLSYQLPSIAGFSSYLLNFPATLQNKNWEFAIDTRNVNTKNFSWNTTFNLTIPNNKLLSFPNLSTSSYSTQLIIGQPVSIGRWLAYDGVDQATGKYKFASKTDAFNPRYPDDYTSLLTTDPEFFGGLKNTLSFKGVELDFLLQFVKQLGYNDAQFWNGGRHPGSFFGGMSNQPVSVLNRWQKPGDNTDIAKFSSIHNFFAQVVSSDYRITDASYMRLKNVSLTWDLLETWTGKARLKKCRLYVHGQNLLTFTDYTGLDPENQNILTPYLPPLRVITVGAQVGF